MPKLKEFLLKVWEFLYQGFLLLCLGVTLLGVGATFLVMGFSILTGYEGAPLGQSIFLWMVLLPGMVFTAGMALFSWIADTFPPKQVEHVWSSRPTEYGSSEISDNNDNSDPGGPTPGYGGSI